MVLYFYPQRNTQSKSQVNVVVNALFKVAQSSGNVLALYHV